MREPVPGWPVAAPGGRTPAAVEALRAEADRLGSAAQYGWGHTIDFGDFRKEGLFGEHFLVMASHFDRWQWWPASLAGLRTADVGCYTGGVAALMGARGAQAVYAVDEIPEHVDQCAFVAGTLGLGAVQPLCASLYQLERHIAPRSLDLVVVAGVLYHLSDMLVGLHALRRLLKPTGQLLLETAAIDEFACSYANFGRFLGGTWWHPTALCIQDMLAFMNYGAVDLRFYLPDRCLVRAANTDAGDPPFRRGMNWPFASLRDARERSMDYAQYAPAPARSDPTPPG